MMKKIFIDIDGTICENRDTLRKILPLATYEDVAPRPERIKIINILYVTGDYHITYWTGRGSVSGEDYTDLTKRQLREWNVEYHELIVGNKPHFDMYVCDKSFNSESWFKNPAAYLTILKNKEKKC